MHTPMPQSDDIKLLGIQCSSRGVAILFNDNLEYHVLKIEKDDIGNLLIVKIRISDELTFLVVVLYGPNRDEPKFHNNLMVKLSEKENLPLVLCGDWNLVQKSQ